MNRQTSSALTRSHIHPVVWVTLLAAATTCAFAGVPAEQETGDPEALRTIFDIGQTTRKLGDWEQQYVQIEKVINVIWEENEWSAEADVFARDLVLEVAHLPPWDYLQRFQLASERLSERYEFTPEQTAQVQGMALREMSGFVLGNSRVLLKQVREWVDATANMEAITPERVAQWTKESDPLLKDARARFDRAVSTLRESLSPDQRAVLDRDLASYRKRMDYITQKRRAWVKGQWHPEDWGMDGETFGGASIDGAGGRDRTERARALPRWKPYQPSTWYAYVLHFERRFKLDTSQADAARSVHAELVERANHYISTHADALRSVPVQERLTHPEFSSIRTWFEELRSRLESLLTRAQREQTD